MPDCDLPLKNTSIERENFSARLRLGLKNANLVCDSPAALARAFNRRAGGSAITVHAARTWLVGEAIPTQARLRSMALWLAVSPEWLRFGDAPLACPPAGRASAARPSRVDLAVLADLQRLDEGQRQLARECVRLLLRMQMARAEPPL